MDFCTSGSSLVGAECFWNSAAEINQIWFTDKFFSFSKVQ